MAFFRLRGLGDYLKENTNIISKNDDGKLITTWNWFADNKELFKKLLLAIWGKNYRYFQKSIWKTQVETSYHVSLIQSTLF